MDLSIFDTGRRTGPFSILTVCTGNICRSPLAEGLLRMVLGGLDVTVQSAGTAALVGEPMTEQNQRIAADLASGELIELRLPERPTIGYALVALWRKDSPPGPAAVWVLDEIRERLAHCP